MNKNTSTRGRTFTGIVTSDKMHNTVTVEWTRRHFIQKYERYSKRKTKVKAHNPKEMDARVGDKVTIMETRPISKTKHFIIIKKHGTDEPSEKEPKAEAKTAEEPKPTKKTVKKPTVNKATKKAQSAEEAPIPEEKSE